LALACTVSEIQRDIAANSQFTIQFTAIVAAPCDDCGTIARFIPEQRGYNLHGEVPSVIITGLGIGLRGLEDIVAISPF